MKFLRRSVGVALLVGLAGCADDVVKFDNGTIAQWDHWQGRWIFVNYWAEWCAPCRKEIPELNEIHQERLKTNVFVFGVNFDGIAGDDLDALTEKMQIEFPNLTEDPHARWGEPKPTVLPTTLVIGPDGDLAGVLVGPQTRETLMAALEGR